MRLDRGTAAAVLLGLLTACMSHAPAPVAYDFEGIEPLPTPAARLSASITVPQIVTPSWLRSTALTYRLGYVQPAPPKAYARSEWIAPPAELLAARLRALVSAANAGFTLPRRAGSVEGYRLEVALEQMEQLFTAPGVSRCQVTLRATVLRARDGRVLAQRTFHAEEAASPDAPGAARGLVGAGDRCLQEMIGWLKASLDQDTRP